jgi:ankyrin repeat protein
MTLHWQHWQHWDAAAVLRAHGAQVSLFFAAKKGMTNKIAAHIAAGQDVNACNEKGRTALELALANDQEAAAAVLRAHGAQVSLFFAAEKGMTDEVAAGIAAGQDVNARDRVIFLCVCVWGKVGVAASLVYTSCIYISILF